MDDERPIHHEALPVVIASFHLTDAEATEPEHL
jgi:hypothetical protein